MPANLENSAVATGLDNVSFHSNLKEKQCQECYHTIALISYASKVMFKILQARLQQYVNIELPDVQAGFRKGKGTRVEKEMATHSSTLDWKIPWMEKPGRLQFMGSLRVGQD